jgi:hypothetical protein
VALCPALLLLTYSRESRITRRVCTLAVLRRRAPLGGRQRNKHLHGLRPELRHETPTASLQVLRLDHLRWLPGEERPPSGVRQTGIISAVQCSAVQCGWGGPLFIVRAQSCEHSLLSLLSQRWFKPDGKLQVGANFGQQQPHITCHPPPHRTAPQYQCPLTPVSPCGATPSLARSQLRLVVGQRSEQKGIQDSLHAMFHV